MASDSDSMNMDEMLGLADTAKEVKALRADKTKLMAEIRSLEEDVGNLNLRFEDLRSELRRIELPRAPKIYKAPSSRARLKPATAVMHWTDEHFGGVQEAEEVEGFGSFSPEIHHARTEKFVQDVINWTELHRHAFRIGTVTILDTGDNISGDIHEELRVTNAFPAPRQACLAAMHKVQRLQMLAQHFDQVVCEFVVVDNHSRLTKKPQHKQAGLNSYNYVVGFIMQVLTETIPEIVVNVYPRETQIVQVDTRRYLLAHGHQIRGWMGFPYYGFERHVAKEALKRMNAPDLKKFHRVICGHYHAPIVHPWYWIGGSVSGTDAYDHSCGRYCGPKQTAWMVHPVHGEFDWTAFDLDVDL